MNKGDESHTYQTSNNETIDHKTIEELSPGVVYYCRVRALIRFNGNDHEGDWSDQIYFTTILRKILLVFIIKNPKNITPSYILSLCLYLITKYQISAQSL